MNVPKEATSSKNAMTYAKKLLFQMQMYRGAFARMVNYCNNGLPGGTETQSACPSHFKLVFTIGRPSHSRRKS